MEATPQLHPQEPPSNLIMQSDLDDLMSDTRTS
eukprot:CAMPEP_0182586856 /NCGR_PEP_ID=MMETSP1324-20130603/63713_1 /TAXON_ID=236786 /ORGANISM="Florenciella sp., Strain RCC1587" /LENGTH=32 /DNA_ID= /DNA_START= /DNA_END= /DNA_ORIENTATION=